MSAKPRSASRDRLLQLVHTPLAFFVLALLITESVLGLFLGLAGFSEEHKWTGFLILIGVFLTVVATVTIFTAINLEICSMAKKNTPIRKLHRKLSRIKLKSSFSIT